LKWGKVQILWNNSKKQKFDPGEIKSRYNSGMLTTIHFRLSCLLTHYPKNMDIKINTAVILPVALYGVKLGPSHYGKNDVPEQIVEKNICT
jgi:hypothetical protein